MDALIFTDIQFHVDSFVSMSGFEQSSSRCGPWHWNVARSAEEKYKRIACILIENTILILSTFCCMTKRHTFVYNFCMFQTNEMAVQSTYISNW